MIGERDAPADDLGPPAPDWYAMVDWETEPEPEPEVDPPDDPDMPTGPLYAAGRDFDHSSHWTKVGGDLYSGMVIQQYAVADTRDVAVRRRFLDRDAMAEQAALFVPPEGLSEQVPVLQGRRVVVLCAPAGAGQRAAAAYLVHELSHRRDVALSVAEVTVDDEFELDRQLRDGDHRTALIVDLVGADGADTERALGDLAGFLTRLQAADSYLVLSVDVRYYDQFVTAYPGRAHRLCPAVAEAVFRRHLGANAGAFVDDLLADEWLRQQLSDAWPPKAARLARLVRSVRGTGDGSAAAVLRDVRQAFGDWSEKLREEMAAHPDAQWRSLLLAAAVLPGAAPASVVQAADVLLRATNYPVPRPHVLEAQGVVTRLSVLQETSLDLRTMRFARPDYGAAVIAHLWAEHPPTQSVLLGWLNRIPTAVTPLTRADLDALADRVVELAVRQDPRVVLRMAQRWATRPGRDGARTGTDGDRSRRSVAVRLLATAATHHVLGRTVREQLYRWVYPGNAPTGLQLVIAEAAGAFGAAYPKVALTRLKHLASSGDTGVVAAVVGAVRQIGLGIGLADLLGYLTDWLDSPSPARAAVLADALRAVFGASDLVATLVSTSGGDPPAPHRGLSTVATFWRTTLDVMPLDECRSLVRAWLTAAAATGDPARTAFMIDGLLLAAGTDLRRMGQLLYATRTSTDLAAGMDEILARVRMRLDEIEPVALSAGGPLVGGTATTPNGGRGTDG